MTTSGQKIHGGSEKQPGTGTSSGTGNSGSDKKFIGTSGEANTARSFIEDSGVSSQQAGKQRRGRNLAIAGALVAFIVLVFLITITKLGANIIVERPL